MEKLESSSNVTFLSKFFGSRWKLISHLKLSFNRRNEPEVPLPNRWTGIACVLWSNGLAGQTDEDINFLRHWSCIRTVLCWKSPAGKTWRPEGLFTASWRFQNMIYLNSHFEIVNKLKKWTCHHAPLG